MADAQRCMPLALSWRTLRYALALLMAAMVLLQTAGVIHRVAHAQQSTEHQHVELGHLVLVSAHAGDLREGGEQDGEGKQQIAQNQREAIA